MVIPSFTQGYPPDNSSLGQTKVTIRDNLDGTFLTLAVDHVDNNGNPGMKPAGYHTLVHQVSQTSVATVAGYNQVFAGVPGTLVVNAVTTPAIPPGGDTQLYSLTGTGTLSQLTGLTNTQTVTGGIGYTWTGGVLMQWGYKKTPGATGSQSFAVTFPNNCFNVQITTDRGATTSSQQTSLAAPPTTTGFSYTGSGSGPNTLYWFAIGN